MAVNDISLNGGLRAGLSNLQLVSMLQSRTTQRLATGLAVNSATDDPAAFFAAQAHRSRANDLSARKDEMSEAIQTVSAASNGVKGITALIEQAKGLVSSARSASTADRASLATQFGDLLTQIDQLASDSGYKGINFLASGSLTVNFNEDGSSNLTITGFDGSSSGLGIGAATGSWAADADINAAVANLATATDTLRTQTTSLASNNGVIAARQSFVSDTINNETTGADNLTLADPNQEAANMLALQTRQQLGIQALSLSSQANKSILRLFG